MAFYPGQRGGQALGKLLWGRANFSGKLPFTWAKSVEDYGLWNGGGTTMFDYHVGYSLFDYRSIDAAVSRSDTGSATRRSRYRKLQLGCSDMSKGAVLPVVVNVENTGTVAGDEVVMVWVSYNTPNRRRDGRPRSSRASRACTSPPASRSRSRFPSACRTSITSRWIPRARRPANGSSKPGASRSRSVAAPRTFR